MASEPTFQGATVFSSSSMMMMMRRRRRIDMVFNMLLSSPFNQLVWLLAQEYFIKIYTVVFWIMKPCSLEC